MVCESELTLILPTLNERPNIVSVIGDVFDVLPAIGAIIVTDDNSTDGTRDEIRSTFAPQIAGGQLRVIHRTSDYGLTQSLSGALAQVRTPLVGWMDCDGSMPAAKLPQLLQSIGQGYEMAIGSRFVSGGEQKPIGRIGNDSFAEVLLSNLLNWALRNLLRLPTTDLTSGFIVTKTEIVNRMEFRGRHGEYFIFLMLQAACRKIKTVEIPYSCGPRRAGTSKTFGTPKALLLNCVRYSMAFLVALFYRARWALGFRTAP